MKITLDEAAIKARQEARTKKDSVGWITRL